MKKILLGLFALSAMAMAATNPGDDNAAAQPKKYGEVGVPMEVRVQILPADKRLILVDENNRKIETLKFDHGQLVKSTTTPNSVVEKTVKLMLEDGSELGAHKVRFKAKKGGTEIVDGKFALAMYNSADGHELESELSYLKNLITTTQHQTEVETKVISTIKNAKIATANPGLYIGQGTFEAAISDNDEKLNNF